MAPVATPVSKRLAAYSVAAGATLALAATPDAQVIYTDIDPDASIGTGETYDLDIDGDGTVDFQVIANTGGGTGTQARIVVNNANTAATNNGALGRQAPYFGTSFIGSAYNLATDAEIGATAAFFPYGIVGSIYGNAPYYPFIGVEGHVGIRFTAGGGGTHYGWIGLALNADATVAQIQGFAYESQAGVSILAGAKGGGVALDPDALPEGFAFSPVAPNPVTGVARFQVAVRETEAVRVEVFDALGRSVDVVHDGPLVGGAARAFHLSSGDLPTGVYVVRVTGESFATSRSITVLR